MWSKKVDCASLGKQASKQHSSTASASVLPGSLPSEGVALKPWRQEHLKYFLGPQPQRTSWRQCVVVAPAPFQGELKAEDNGAHGPVGPKEPKSPFVG